MPLIKDIMKELDIFKADISSHIKLSYSEEGIRAGFPSPSQDYSERLLDLNKELIQHPSATFLAKVVGLSMINAGIDEGDILIIDRSIEPHDGSIVVAYLEGEFTAKRLDMSQIKRGKIYLRSENEEYPDFCITPEDKFLIWGVVSSVIKRIDKR